MAGASELFCVEEYKIDNFAEILMTRTKMTWLGKQVLEPVTHETEKTFF